MNGREGVRRSRGSPDRLLRRVVGQWADNIELLANEWRDTGDLPWLYGERALLSVVAGTVWKMGGTAFEEYGSEKRSEKNQPFGGREDIHFSYRQRGFKGEAKLQSISATRITPTSARLLRDKLQQAVNDVKKCSADRQERLGILFAVPYVMKTHVTADHQLDRFIRQWIEEVFHQVPCAASAAIFPKSVRKKCWYGHQYAYPGAAIFVRKA
jgi:hypothetical protein